jgi:hypothetical protein
MKLEVREKVQLITNRLNEMANVLEHSLGGKKHMQELVAEVDELWGDLKQDASNYCDWVKKYNEENKPCCCGLEVGSICGNSENSGCCQ